MSDEDLFQTALDAALSDGPARLLFADWLAERGDDRASVYRWLASHQRWPNRAETSSDPDRWSGPTWDWWCRRSDWDGQAGSDIEGESVLPERVFVALSPGQYQSDWGWDCAYEEYPDRRRAEEALAEALTVSEPGGAT